MNVIYKRRIKYHDKDNIIRESELEITTINGYIEYTQSNPDCQSDFNPKEEPQTALHNLWTTWHIRKYCELDDRPKIEELINLCNSICDSIEQEEEEYLNSIGRKTEDDIDDDRILALGNHLGLTYSEMYDDIIKVRYGDYNYEYGNQEYLVMTDCEANILYDECLSNYIEECILPELPKGYRKYFDNDAWKEDVAIDGREHWLASYDGREYCKEVNGETYYIYRIN